MTVIQIASGQRAPPNGRQDRMSGTIITPTLTGDLDLCTADGSRSSVGAGGSVAGWSQIAQSRMSAMVSLKPLSRSGMNPRKTQLN